MEVLILLKIPDRDEAPSQDLLHSAFYVKKCQHCKTLHNTHGITGTAWAKSYFFNHRYFWKFYTFLIFPELTKLLCKDPHTSSFLDVYRSANTVDYLIGTPSPTFRNIAQHPRDHGNCLSKLSLCIFLTKNWLVALSKYLWGKCLDKIILYSGYLTGPSLTFKDIFGNMDTK